MKIMASATNYLIRILSFDYDENVIESFLRNRSSYISSYNPFLEIEGPDRECDEVMNFLYQQELDFKVY